MPPSRLSRYLTRPTWKLTKHRVVEWLLVLLIVCGGAAIRTWRLDSSPFWVDEAESSINALTILQHGYPNDTYLGMPIYENTYTWKWPESSEYEFRDSSYSAKHFAIYHGWLPLYSIAASFAISGIRPDVVDESRTTKHTEREQRERTRAGRLPAVLFGSLFLLLIFAGGNVLYGRDAGWAALLLGAVNPHHIELSRQARYYSAEVLLTTAVSLLTWLLVREAKWKYVGLHALCLTLLFYTHLLSFLTGVVMLAILTLIVSVRDRAVWAKSIASASLVALGTGPWFIVTGFLQDQARIPRAWSLLRFPGDLVRYPPAQLWALVIGVLVVTLSTWIVCWKPRLPDRVALPFRQLWPILGVLGLWAVCAYTIFLTCIPAVSFSGDRINLPYWGPLFVLFSVISAAIARAILGRASIIFGSVLMLAILVSTGHSIGLRTRNDTSWAKYRAVFQDIDRRGLGPESRIYAFPNAHLVLTFYSGLPIQDITPVRKCFLDNYRGEILLIDSTVATYSDILSPEQIRDTARQHGVHLSSFMAEQWSALLASESYRERMTEIIAPGEQSRLDRLPPFALDVLSAHGAEIERYFNQFEYELITRGFNIRDWSEWVTVCKYRFVHPEHRSGALANYAERLQGSEAVILPLEDPVAIYSSRFHAQRTRVRSVFRNPS